MSYNMPRPTASMAPDSSVFRPASAPGLSPYSIHTEYVNREYVSRTGDAYKTGSSPLGSPLEELLDVHPYSEYFAEFIGTFLLVYTVGAVSIAGNSGWSATAVGFLLMVLVYALRPVSGAHLNPAVTIALGFLGSCPPQKVGKYVLVQLGAGILAGASVSGALGEGILFGPVAPYGIFGALTLELIYTAMLCFVILSVTTSSRNNPLEDQNNFFGLAIGFVVIAGGYAAGGISGASFNPAISLGLACTSFSMSISPALLYSVVEVVGGMLAVLLFYVCHPEDFPVYTRELAPGSVALRLLSEFFGTFVIVLTVGLNLVTKSGATAWSAGAALISMTYSLEGVSGAHFNPAVTCAVVLCGRQKCRPMIGLAYGSIQLVAGILAGYLYQHFQVTGRDPDEVFGLAPAEPFLGFGSCLVVEFFFTFGVAYAVLACATTELPPSASSSNFYFALALGAAFAGGGLASRAVSGGILNPAAAFGVSTGSQIAWRGGNFVPPPWTYCLWYTFAELLGAAAAAAAFHCTHFTEYTGKVY